MSRSGVKKRVSESLSRLLGGEPRWKCGAGEAGGGGKEGTHHLELGPRWRRGGVAELEQRLDQILLDADGVPPGAVLELLGLVLPGEPLLLFFGLSRLLRLARGREVLLSRLVLFEVQEPLLVQRPQRHRRGGDRGGRVHHPGHVAPALGAAHRVESAPLRDVVVERLQVQLLAAVDGPARDALPAALHEVGVLGPEAPVLPLLQPELQLVHRLDARLEGEGSGVLIERDLERTRRDDPADAELLRLGADGGDVPQRIGELIFRGMVHRRLLQRAQAILLAHGASGRNLRGRLRCFFPVGPGGYYASAPVLCVARACARRPRSNLSRVCAARARLRPGSPRSPSDRTDPRAVAPSPMPVRRCPAGRARVYNRFGLGRMLGRQKNTTKHRQTVRFQPKDAGKTRNGGLFLSRTKFNAEASRMVQTAPAPAEISDGGPGPGALQPAHGWRHVPALRR